MYIYIYIYRERFIYTYMKAFVYAVNILHTPPQTSLKGFDCGQISEILQVNMKPTLRPHGRNNFLNPQKMMKMI